MSDNGYFGAEKYLFVKREIRGMSLSEFSSSLMIHQLKPSQCLKPLQPSQPFATLETLATLEILATLETLATFEILATLETSTPSTRAKIMNEAERT